MKNLMNKTRKIENPYATFHGNNNFVRQILRAYTTKTPEENPNASWYTCTKSDFTYGAYEGGDSYISESVNYLELVYASEEFRKQYPNLTLHLT
jgi:hypothetical protein